MGFPVGFTGLPAVDGVGRKERRLTAGLPRPYHPSTPASGAPLPLGGLGSRSPSPAGPSPHVGRRLPGPCSPGACQTQTGSQAKRGAPSQEDTGSTTQQRDEGDAPTARNAPPRGGRKRPQARAHAKPSPTHPERELFGLHTQHRAGARGPHSLPALHRRRTGPVSGTRQ